MALFLKDSSASVALFHIHPTSEAHSARYCTPDCHGRAKTPEPADVVCGRPAKGYSSSLPKRSQAYALKLHRIMLICLKYHSHETSLTLISRPTKSQRHGGIRT